MARKFGRGKRPVGKFAARSQQQSCTCTQRSWLCSFHTASPLLSSPAMLASEPLPTCTIAEADEQRQPTETPTAHAHAIGLGLGLGRARFVRFARVGPAEPPASPALRPPLVGLCYSGDFRALDYTHSSTAKHVTHAFGGEHIHFFYLTPFYGERHGCSDSTCLRSTGPLRKGRESRDSNSALVRACARGRLCTTARALDR